ncbi:Fe-S cluster assembly protein SufD [Reinekea blandensis]|uniref:Cysteine desulfurase activator SufB n=1 Tax=Reinekea blandensis MED297 TaxID=314283 RepID=A4BH31_9GAMM|nr:Fe-S cluster assembly protein SufD [Reinekea blandensis]EAR08530.1 Cysteine desulfurase activator SufB [Reinekea sp. MED297] [Reinekea blandensis MED297]
MSDAMNIAKAVSKQEAWSRPQWLQQWQQAGLDRFRETPWPTRKTEHWKYTPLKSLTGIDWSLPEPKTSVADGIRFDDWNAIRLNIVNGELQNPGDLPTGVSLVRLSECNQEQAERFLAALEASRNDFLFDTANQAFIQDAYWLNVDPNTQVQQALHLNYVTDGDDVLSSSQIWINLGVGAQVTVVETFSAGEQGRCLVNANTAITLADNARMTHYHLMLEEGDAHHIGRVTAELQRSAYLDSFHVGIGGVLKRKDIRVRHCGEGAELRLNGVYLPKGAEIIDYHTCIEHEVPHCTSEEIFRGIISDSAKAVFNGRIHIHKDAQKSLAEMNNRNLLLSDQAEIDTKPELEIYADDVKCAHGATIARLDDTQLFYFQARGISRAEAEVMLSFGFINELLDSLQDEAVQNLLRPLLATLFAHQRSELTRHLL